MSPLFHKKSEDEKEAEQAAKQAQAEGAERSVKRAAASLELIEQGHIPVAAAERLARFTEPGADAGQSTTVFSSDLAVSEWSALARLDVKPITQVMGSSIYHVGWQPTYYNVPTEVRVLSDAYNESRRWPTTPPAPRACPRRAAPACSRTAPAVHQRPVGQRVPARPPGRLRAARAGDRQLDLPHRLPAGAVEAEPGDGRCSPRRCTRRASSR
jgi:hypothetical protein